MSRCHGTIVFFACLSFTAVAQTNGAAPTPPKKQASNTTRTIPAIKCVDHDTVTACKSFKELVDARDERILREVLGDPGTANRHVSYVCLRPKSDTFSVIEFDIPELKEYRPFSTINQDLVRYADDSNPTNRSFRENLQRTKKLIEDSILSDFSDPRSSVSTPRTNGFKTTGAILRTASEL